MAINSFIPEVWSTSLLESLKKTLVYGGITNRDYEGEISQSGDTVRITSISRPTVGTYTPGSTTITPEQLVDAQRTLVIDQCKYWAFEVDDVDARQAAGDLIGPATREAAFALADVVDQYIAGLYTGIQSANAITTPVTVTGESTEEWTRVWDDILVPLAVLLDEANVPREGRFAVIPPWLQGGLIRDDRFVRLDASGSPEALRNGQVGRAAGFDILLSNNCPVPSANQSVVIAGNTTAITFAEQIAKVEAYRPESSFSDAVKGLALYGAKLVRPDSLAYAIAASA